MARKFPYSITVANGIVTALSLDNLQGTDLPASGVTASTYGDSTHYPTLTVDAAGRVTSASSVKVNGPSFALTDPTTPSWAWQNQGSATVSTTGGFVSITGPSQNSDSIHARVVSLPASGTAYTFTALVHTLAPGGGFEGGLVLSDATKYIVFFHQGARQGVRKYNSNTSFNSSYFFDGGSASTCQVWLRIADAGGSSTNAVTFQESVDGQNWSTYVTRNRADFLTESVIGFYINSNNAGGLNGMNGTATLYSWLQQ